MATRTRRDTDWFKGSLQEGTYEGLMEAWDWLLYVNHKPQAFTPSIEPEWKAAREAELFGSAIISEQPGLAYLIALVSSSLPPADKLLPALAAVPLHPEDDDHCFGTRLRAGGAENLLLALNFLVIRKWKPGLMRSLTEGRALMVQAKQLFDELRDHERYDLAQLVAMHFASAETCAVWLEALPD